MRAAQQIVSRLSISSSEWDAAMHDDRPLLFRIVNPGVPWWVAVPCNILAGIALLLLAIDPAGYLVTALTILVPAAIALYGTAGRS
jgi:hypothetical protein